MERRIKPPIWAYNPPAFELKGESGFSSQMQAGTGKYAPSATTDGEDSMMRQSLGSLWGMAVLTTLLASPLALADGDLHKVNHIIIVMQENHSFDNYFGVLPYVSSGPYHSPNIVSQILRLGCRPDDHACVDGLSCSTKSDGTLRCFNFNFDDDHRPVFAFPATSRCVIPDLDHSWVGSHGEANFLNPNNSLLSWNDGFVLVNDATEQHDNGENATDDQTISFYNQADLPFYYDLAEKFAIGDRYFSSVLAQTMPNRSYLMAATSFGHLTTSDSFPPPGGYKPITGTIFDLLDHNGVSWADYFQDVPQGLAFRVPGVDPHLLPLPFFFAQLAAGSLPQVVFIDPNFGFTNGLLAENDEHPPTDIQRGQAYVSTLINAIRNSPSWKDSIIFIVYDEHGGFYDHTPSPRARQNSARTPDGISPGQCADLSNPPFSLQPGGGAECASNFFSTTDTSVLDAEALCRALAANPTGPFPSRCASFDQYGFRVPFIAVSPFSKQHYVSHTVGDHTSLLALIEKRFLPSGSGGSLHLTARDQNANTLEDLFDFNNSPSLHTPVTQAAPPVVDCTP
jgi:phospholipase C